MALIKCKGCGKEISKKAKVCPECGEPAPKKTALVTWLVLIMFILIAVNYPDKPIAAEKSQKEIAKDLVKMDKYEWTTVGFNNVLEANFIVKNDSEFVIKDIEITCTHYAKSGTKIDSNKRTIYDTVNAKSSKAFDKFNMGFIRNQVEKSGCRITDFKI